MSALVAEVLGWTGTVALLGAFAASSFGWLTPNSRPHLASNAVAGGLAGLSAWMQGQWEFLALEGIWGLIALLMLGKTLLVDARSCEELE